MRNDNLKRDEAIERASLISDVSYDITLDVTGDADTFGSETTVRFRCAEPGSATFIDLDAVSVHSAELNDRSLGTDLSDAGRLRIDDLASENTLRIVADCEYSKTGTGLHRFRDPVDDLLYAYTQFEPFDAHRVYPCFDQPDIKATFAFAIDVPEGFVAVSNAPVASRPEEGKAGRWAFEPTPRMSTYITALCLGPFYGVGDHHDGIDLGWWCRQSLAQYLDPDELFEITKQGFDFYHQVFDYRYPFGKYDQVFCPEYKFGAMENAGCVTYAEGFLFRSRVTEAQRERRAEVILHEMAHMWFGDLVTMRWWDDLWLNESFATYMAVLSQTRATRFTNAWTTFATREKGWAYHQDQLPTTHPILADIPDVEATHLNFDGITYAKGASVLKQLVAWVGEDAFFEGLRRYFRRFEYANTELGDFLDALEQASGRDLRAWSKEWLEAAGVNSLGTSFDVQDGALRNLHLEQHAVDAYPTLRSHRVAVGLYSEGEDGLVRTGRHELDVTGERTAVPELDGQPAADLVLPNDEDLTYAKIRFDDRSLDTLADRLHRLGDPLARALSWSAVWEMVRDAELASRDYVRLVLNNVDGETDIGMIQRLIGQMSGAIFRYGDPANRDAGARTFAGAARERMYAAEPGSDTQLTWTRAFIGTARTEEWLEEIRRILSGETEVPGLAVDTDLRWGIVRALASAGTADEDVIAVELERDPTDQGQRHAAAARASRPTPEAKAHAWKRLTEDKEITTSMVRSVAGGFQQLDQEDLLEPYVAAYFDTVVPYWHARGLEYGLEFAEGLYPETVVSETTVRATDAMLDRDEIPPPVRRVLLEGRDQLQRTMRARAKDAS